jgi:thiamine-monophosphate kinase
MTPTRTEISTLGEFGLIDRISKKFKIYNKSTELGIGDDAAILKTSKNRQLLSADLLIEGVHFDLSYVPLKHLGYKAVVVNVSDIAAMNGQPRQITISMGLSNRFSVEAVDELFEGIKIACDHYKVDLAGGDTSSSGTGLILSVAITGEVAPDRIVKRSTARINDVICVTGDLGGAYVGLQVLEREKQEFLVNPDMHPKLESYDYVVKRQLKPEARMDIIPELSDAGVIPMSMIDISDGVASDLMHICHQSNVGANIYEDKLPIAKMTYDTAVEFNMDPITCVLNGGEDYELLFTIKQEDYEKIKNHPDIHFIGYIHEKDKGINLVTKGKNTVPLRAQGWEHFKKL